MSPACVSEEIETYIPTLVFKARSTRFCVMNSGEADLLVAQRYISSLDPCIFHWTGFRKGSRELVASFLDCRASLALALKLDLCTSLFHS